MTTTTQPTTTETGESERTTWAAVTAMLAVIVIAATIALTVITVQPDPVVIEVAPDDSFTHAHQDERQAPPGMFPHIEHKGDQI